MWSSRPRPSEPSAATTRTPASPTSSKKKPPRSCDDNPHLDSVIVACSPHAPGRLRADIALVRRLRRERYDLAIDFHGGPRSSLLTWLSGAPDANRIRSRRTKLDVHDPRAPAQDAPTAALGRQSVGRAAAARHRAARPGARCDRRCRTIPSRLDTSSAGLPKPASRAGQPVIVVHVSAGNPFRRWPFGGIRRPGRAGSRQRDPRRRIILTSGPSDAAAAAAIAEDARARLGTSERQAILRMRRVRSRRVESAHRSSGVVHRRRQRTAAHRGNHRRAGRRVVWADAARCDRSRFEARDSSARRRKCPICRAGRAISADASPAIFAASPASRPRQWRHSRSGRSAGLKASTTTVVAVIPTPTVVVPATVVPTPTVVVPTFRSAKGCS